MNKPTQVVAKKKITLDQLLGEISSISDSELIAHKKREAEQLVQLQGQVVEALGLLKDVVDTLKTMEPKAVETIFSAVLTIFERGDGDEENENLSPLVVQKTFLSLK